MIIKEGDCFYKRYDKRKYHIIKIIEDNNKKLVIYKFYGIHK